MLFMYFICVILPGIVLTNTNIIFYKHYFFLSAKYFHG